MFKTGTRIPKRTFASIPIPMPRRAPIGCHRAILVFALILAGAVVTSRSTAQGPPGNTGVHGYVRDGLTNLPLSGATVTIGAQTVTTDGSGYYSIYVSAGTYEVSASNPYYTTQTHTGVVVVENQLTARDFTLSPTTGTISGRVMDEHFKKNIPETGKTILVTNGTLTVQSGGYQQPSYEYEMQYVPPGTYNLTCSYPGLPSQRRVVTVVAGQEETVDFVLGRCVVFGTVKDSQGQPLSGVKVSDGTWTARTDSNGRYEILWPPQGMYEFTASLNGFRTVKKSLDLAANNKQVLDFTLPPPMVLTNVTATPGNGQIVLAWTNPTVSDFDHVNVYRSNIAGQVGLKIGQTTGPTIATYTDTGLNNGKVYYFVLKAVDQSGIESDGFVSRTWTSQTDWAQWFLNGLTATTCVGALEIANTLNEATGQGIAIRAVVGGTITVLADSGLLITPTGTKETTLAKGEVSPILTAETMRGYTTSTIGRVDSEGYANKVAINAGGNNITADFVKGTSAAVTTGLTVSGSIQVTNLVVNGQSITPSGAVGQVITLPNNGKVVFNEQITSVTANKAEITLNAMRVIVAAGRGAVLFNKAANERLKINGNNIRVTGGGHSNQDLEVNGNSITVTDLVTYYGNETISGTGNSITRQHVTDLRAAPLLPRPLSQYKTDAQAAGTYFTGKADLTMGSGGGIWVKGAGPDKLVPNGSIIYVQGEIKINEKNFNRKVTLIATKAGSNDKGDVFLNHDHFRLVPADGKLLAHGDGKVHVNGKSAVLQGILDAGAELHVNGNGHNINGYLWGHGIHLNGNDTTITGQLNIGSEDVDVVIGQARSGVKLANQNNNEGYGTILYRPQQSVVQIWSESQLASSICDNAPFESVWIANSSGDSVSRLNVSTGATIATYALDGTPDGSTFPSRSMVAFDGTYWVANRQGNSVTRIKTDGTVTTFPIDSTTYGSLPRALCIDHNGFVWVGMYNGPPSSPPPIPPPPSYPKLLKLDPITGAILASYNMSGGAYGMALDRRNRIWITTHNPSKMVQFSPALGQVVREIPWGSNDGIPYVANIGDDGAIWVSSYGGQRRIYRIDPDTGSDPTYFSLPDQADATGMRGIAMDPDGTMWVAETSDSRMWRFRARDGLIYGIFPAGTTPTGVARDVKGNMWVANMNSYYSGYTGSDAYKYAPDGRVIGRYKVGSGPYNYSHMTGMSALQSSHTTLLEYSLDGQNWTSELTDVPPSEGVHIRFTLGRANPSTSPTVDEFTIRSLPQFACTPLAAPAAAWAAIAAPNGGERWLIGVPTPIRWASSDPQSIVASVRLYYRTADGNPWNQIVQGEANDGVYTWTVPSAATTTARSKIELYNSASQLISADESDELFTISAWGKVTGLVTDSVSGAPLPSAIVTDGSQTVTTGSDGRYLIDRVPAGAVVLQASEGSHLSKSVSGTVTADQTTTLNITLDKPASIEGTVTDSNNGLILGGAIVSELSQTTFTTLADGKYKFHGYAPGTYTVTVVRAGYQNKTLNITVTAGQAGILNFPMARAGFGKIRGVVTGTSSIPLPGATVSVGSISSVTDESGRFTLHNVAAGSQTVNASRTGYQTNGLAVTVNAGEVAVRDIPLTATNPGSGTGVVTGTVTDQDGGAALNLAVVTINNLSATTDASGVYTISNVPPGTHVLIAHEGNHMANSYNYIPREYSVIVTNGNTTTQNIQLTAYGQISGKVFERRINPPWNGQGGPPPPPYTDIMISQALISTGSRTARSGVWEGWQSGYTPPGEYNIFEMVPGTYTLTATASGYIPAKQTITVASKNTTTADFRMYAAGDISGTVKTGAGVPIAGATVESGLNTAVTAADGVYALTNVPTGTATVIAYKAGYQSQTQSVTVEQAKVATLDFTLNTATTGIIKGIVKRSDTSKPLRNASVSTPVGMTNLIAITREDGSYTLTDVPADQRSVTVVKAGFANGNATVTVVAGQTLIQDFNLTVTDTTPPTVADQLPTGITKKIKPTISATLSDGAGSGIEPDSIELVLDSMRVPHTFNVLTGKLTWTATENLATGIRNVRILVKDRADNATTFTWTFDVQPDTTAPSVSISSPVSSTGADALVEGVVNIVGSASDNEYPLQWYLKIKPVDDPNWSTLKTGTLANALSNATITPLHTTVMVNGRYNVKIEVVDVGDNRAEATTDVLVKGTLKLGQFARTEAPDISVPFVNGVPFHLTRAYNSHDYHTQPFQRGWTHNYNLSLVEDTRYSNNQHHDGSVFYGYVVASLPDGNRMVFTPVGYDGNQVNYTAPKESKETLARLTEPHPDFPEDQFILHYVLTTKDGSVYRFKSQAELLVQWALHDGELVGMEDRFGNMVSITKSPDKLEIEDGSIQNNQFTAIGRKITVNLGSDGRAISAVYTSPTADVTRQVNYGYGTTGPEFSVTQYATAPVADENGNLTSINPVTEYSYEIPPTNFPEKSGRLAKVVLPTQASTTKLPVIEVTYDSEGRMTEQKGFVTATQFSRTVFAFTPGQNGDYTTSATTKKSDNTDLGVTNIDHQSNGTLKSGQVTPNGAPGPLVSGLNLFNDTNNPFTPTQMKKSSDAIDRYRTSIYQPNGNVSEQKVYRTATVNGNGQVTGGEAVVRTFEYDGTYNQVNRTVTYQGYNGTGKRQESRRVLGKADGTVGSGNQNKYLSEEKVLTADPNGVPGDADDVYSLVRNKYDTDPTIAVKGLQTESIDGALNKTASFYDPLGRINKLQVTDPGNTRTATTFRSTTDSIGSSLLAASAMSAVTRNRYDGLGRLYEIRKIADQTALTRTDFTTAYYDSQTALETTRFGYDRSGNQTYSRTTWRDGSDDVGVVTRSIYTLGNKLQRTERFAYLNGAETFQSRADVVVDDLGNTTQTAAWDGVKTWRTNFVYDNQNRLTDQKQLAVDSTTTVLRHVHIDYFDSGLKKREIIYRGDGVNQESQVEYGYDSFDRLNKITLEAGANDLVTEFGYDALGHRIVTKDARGSFVFHRYGHSGELIEVSFPINNITVDLNNPVWHAQAKVSVHNDYYSDGNLQKVTRYDADGTTILTWKEFTYDEQDRVRTVTEPITSTTNSVTTFEYKDAGQTPWTFMGDAAQYTKKITDAEGRASYQALDAAGRAIRIRHADGQVEEKEYHDNGNVKTVTVYERNGTKRQTTLEYTDDGKLWKKVYPDAGFVELIYDALGRRIAAIDNRTAAHRMGGRDRMDWTYDSLGRVESVLLHDNRKISYAYTATSKRTLLKVENAAMATEYSVTYDYDAADRIYHVYEGAQTIATYGWDGNGNLATLQYNQVGSAVSTFTHNLSNRLTQIRSALGADTLCQFDFTLDGLGRRTSIAELLKTTAGTSVSYNLNYTYDRLQRLLSEIRTSGAQTLVNDTYTFDKVGNRLTKNAGAFTYAANSNKIVGDPQGNSYTFDLNGGQITKGGSQHEFDWENQLKKVTGTDGKVTEYWYDLDGNRIRKSVTQSMTTTTTQYVVDGNMAFAQVLMELDGAGSITAKYSYGHNRLKVSRNGEYYYFYDGIGSTRIVTNTSGAVQNRYSYDAYGNPLAGETEQTITNEYTFANERRDPETGLTYLRARYYDPSPGRFAQLDTYAGDPERPTTHHRYLYGLANPVSYVDPSGHESLLGLLSVTSILSILRQEHLDSSLNAMTYIIDKYNMYIEPVIYDYNALFLMLETGYDDEAEEEEDDEGEEGEGGGLDEGFSSSAFSANAMGPRGGKLPAALLLLKFESWGGRAKGLTLKNPAMFYRTTTHGKKVYGWLDERQEIDGVLYLIEDKSYRFMDKIPDCIWKRIMRKTRKQARRVDALSKTGNEALDGAGKGGQPLLRIEIPFDPTKSKDVRFVKRWERLEKMYRMRGFKIMRKIGGGPFELLD